MNWPYLKQLWASSTVKTAVLQFIAAVVGIWYFRDMSEVVVLCVGLAIKSAIDVWARVHVDSPVESFLLDRTNQIAIGQALIGCGLLTSTNQVMFKTSFLLFGKSVFDL